jgi:hypothetical protein
MIHNTKEENSMKNVYYPRALNYIWCILFLMSVTSTAMAGESPVNLGSAANFEALAGSTVTNVVSAGTVITGDVGVSPGTAVTGFPPGIVIGTIHAGDPVAAQAQLDLTVAYNDAAGRSTAPVTVSGNLGGMTLYPGLYKSTSSLEISSGDLTLHALGDPNAVFIFQMASTLTTSPGRQVILAGNAQAANIFWQVGSSATLGTTTIFYGTIMADISITLNTGATLDGRALARSGAVTLDSNMATVPTPPPTPVLKWSQPPYELEPGVSLGWDEKSTSGGLQIVADDWLCTTTQPVTGVHWWGSYIGWTEPVPAPDAPESFQIGIWNDVPSGINAPFSHPGTMIWEYIVPRAELNETYAGMDELTSPQLSSSFFKYDLNLPQSDWFFQGPGENIYWLSVTAIYPGNSPSPFTWGWTTRPYFYNDEAIVIYQPTAPTPGMPFIEGEPISMKYSYSEPWDMAFDLMTTDTLFCAPPLQPHDPDPADDAEGAPIDTNLTWNNAVEPLGNIQFIQAKPERNPTLKGIDALIFTLQCPVTYDVYFGTNDPPTNLICQDTTETLCSPGILENGTEYFWSVVAKNDGGETEGPVWSFTTDMTPTPTPTPTPTATATATATSTATPTATATSTATFTATPTATATSTATFTATPTATATSTATSTATPTATATSTATFTATPTATATSTATSTATPTATATSTATSTATPTATATSTATATPTPTATPIQWYCYCCPAEQDWTKISKDDDGTLIPSLDFIFYVARHLKDFCAIGVSGDPTKNVYGGWESPHDQIPYVPNNIYRIKYTVRTTQRDKNHVPNLRLLAETIIDDKSMTVAGGNRIGKGIFAPDANGETYSVYFAPPDQTSTFPAVTNIRIKFEVIDFDMNEDGINYMDMVLVERFPIPEKAEGTLIKTINSPEDFSDWVTQTLPSVGEATLGSDAKGLFISTPGSLDPSGLVYGMWSLPPADSPISFEPNRLYRAVYNLSAPTLEDHMNMGMVRLYTHNLGGNWSSELHLNPGVVQNHMPTVEGSEYNVFFESMPALYTGEEADKNKFGFMFDVADGSSLQEGTVYLEKVELYYYDLP